MTKKEQTRVNIMQVALKLFSEQGYYQTTTKQIAIDSNVNELTLFRHFGSKENLFQETTTYYVENINIKNEIERLKRQDFNESIQEIAMDYLDFCYRNEKLYKIQMRLPDEMKGFVRLKLSRGFEKELEGYFQILKNENKVSGDPEKMAVTFINSILGAFTINVLSFNTFTEIPLEELVKEHARQFANYYKGGKS
jgi:AcrR family transcriptional regulator